MMTLIALLAGTSGICGLFAVMAWCADLQERPHARARHLAERQSERCVLIRPADQWPPR